MRAKILVSSGLFILLSPGLFSQAPKPAPENLPARVDAIFQKMDSTVSPGCALSVMKDGKIIYERGYGMADLDHNVSITPVTVFHVASMSKQFTAASILLLAQQGKLSLDDPVRKYIPELPDFGTPVTIRQLIHHTSGLRDQWDLLGLSGWRYSLDLITNDDVLYVISHQKELNFPPGTKHLYSNTGYTLLGELVKRVSGKSLREFTTENIFQPLGMKNTHFRDDHAEIIKNIAYGYEPAKDNFRLSVTNFDTVGATSLMTTVEDLALWDDNFYNPRVGGPELLKQMLERGKLNNGEQLDYASGLVVTKYRGLNIVDHGGADAGYRSDMIRFPDQLFSSACLCNLSVANPSGLNRKVADIYLEKEMAPAETAHTDDEKPVHLTPEQLAANVGTYLSQDDEVIRIFVKGNALRVGDDNGSYELKPLAPNRFRPPFGPFDFTFDAKKEDPARLTIKWNVEKPEVYKAVSPFAPSEAELKPYAGAYSSEEIDPVYTLAIEHGKLVLHRLKADPDTLLPVTRELFAGSVGSVKFTRGAKGEITGFLLSTGRIRNLRFTKGRPAIAAQ